MSALLFGFNHICYLSTAQYELNHLHINVIETEIREVFHYEKFNEIQIQFALKRMMGGDTRVCSWCAFFTPYVNRTALILYCITAGTKCFPQTHDTFECRKTFSKQPFGF